MQTKSNKQTPEMAGHDLLVSLTPEAIERQPVFEGIEIAVLSGDPSKAGSRFVIRAKHRDGLIVPPQALVNDGPGILKGFFPFLSPIVFLKTFPSVWLLGVKRNFVAL